MISSSVFCFIFVFLFFAFGQDDCAIANPQKMGLEDIQPPVMLSRYNVSLVNPLYHTHPAETSVPGHKEV